METQLISKSLVESHRQCPKRAWLEARGVDGSRSMTSTGMLEQGKRVHAAAREILTGAVDIPCTLKLVDAAEATALAMARGAATITEAAFVAGSLGVRVDILECDPDRGVHLVEVKSGGSVKDRYVDDVAIQVACLAAAGVRVKSAWVLHPSSALPLEAGQALATVMLRQDVTHAATDRAVQVDAWVQACMETVNGPEPGDVPGEHCTSPHPCQYQGRCGQVAEDADTSLIRFLPRKGPVVKACSDAGMLRINELPAEAFHDDRNAIVRDAVLSGSPVIRQWFARKLADLPYPRHFVDFEAVGPALPLHVGMRPFEALAFQWSAHTESADKSIRPGSFLDTSGADPRRGFIESLLSFVGEDGPVLVYGSYERHRLGSMARLFPDLAGSIEALVGRLVDLLPMARLGYYDVRMRGKWSLKSILPTVPEAAQAGLSYEAAADVNDGLAAQAAYLAILDPSTTEEARADLRQQLLDYCAVDTAGLLYFCRMVESVAHDEARQRTAADSGVAAACL